MRQPISAEHRVDINNHPSGGHTTGTGIDIWWQDGPLGKGPDRREPNGAFVEGVIEAARDRLEFYQYAADGKFASDENAEAMILLEQAMEALDRRTADRTARGVEGTHGI